MVDLPSIYRVIRSIEPHFRLVLVGDSYQLPPVDRACCFTNWPTMKRFRSRNSKTFVDTRRDSPSCGEHSSGRVAKFAQLCRSGHRVLGM